MNKVISSPVRHTRQLIFDVETTGLLSKKSIPIAEQPHILQLAFVCYDLNEQRIVQKYDSLVNIPKEVEISDFVVNLTGITKSMCEETGKPILQVLQDFYQAYMWCDELVAHNIEFDREMILLEIERYRRQITDHTPECFTLFSPMYERVNNVDIYCTMKKGMSVSALETKPQEPTTTSTVPKKITKKWPKLIELYTSLFPNDPLPTNMHNAMVDVLTCLRCYLKMRHNLQTTQ